MILFSPENIKPVELKKPIIHLSAELGVYYTTIFFSKS